MGWDCCWEIGWCGNSAWKPHVRSVETNDWATRLGGKVVSQLESRESLSYESWQQGAAGKIYSEMGY